MKVTKTQISIIPQGNKHLTNSSTKQELGLHWSSERICIAFVAPNVPFDVFTSGVAGIPAVSHERMNCCVI